MRNFSKIEILVLIDFVIPNIPWPKSLKPLEVILGFE